MSLFIQIIDFDELKEVLFSFLTSKQLIWLK